MQKLVLRQLTIVFVWSLLRRDHGPLRSTVRPMVAVEDDSGSHARPGSTLPGGPNCAPGTPVLLIVVDRDHADGVIVVREYFRAAQERL